MRLFFTKIIYFLNIFFTFFGLKVLTKKELNLHLNLKKNAVFELTKLYKGDRDKGLTCVIFSKNRAMQLYALLESHQIFLKNTVPIIVIYTVTTVDHLESYVEVKKLINLTSLSVQFIEEKNGFRHTLLSVLQKIKTKSMFFMTDDQVFTDFLDLTPIFDINSSSHIFSLRLNPNIQYSYAQNRKYTPPHFNNSTCGNFLEFDWFEAQGGWSYPWSVDAHIFCTAEIYSLSLVSKYNNPNSYEGALTFFNHLLEGKKGLCLKRGFTLNIPINLVQEEVPNRAGSVSSEYLLSQWNEGLKISMDSFKGIESKSTHSEVDLVFIRRY
ncbi:hypothetical protein HOO14_06200 [bacterium]|nr:hypothetical protein [bacterium]